MIFIVWVLFAIKDSRNISTELRNKLPRVLRPNLEIPMCNFILRFSYQTYLEVSVCVFISLNCSGLLINQKFFMQWFISIILLTAMTSFIAFLCYKLFMGGPYPRLPR